MTRQRPQPIVSDHAVLRYIERVWGVDLAPWRTMVGMAGHPSHDSLVLQHLERAGLGVEDIRREIFTPAVQLALAAGAACVRCGDAMIMLRGGVVATVYIANNRDKLRRELDRRTTAFLSDGGRGPRARARAGRRRRLDLDRHVMEDVA